jgi:hypothetical protein
MIFTKAEAGVVIPGATVHNVTEQSFEIIRFAWRQGFDTNITELEKAYNEYLNDESSDVDLDEDLGWEVEAALDYLNSNCVDGVVFTFVDSDLVILDSNYDGVVE